MLSCGYGCKATVALCVLAPTCENRGDPLCRVCQAYGVLVGPAKPLTGTGGQVVRGTGNLAPLIVLPNDGINGTNYNVIVTQSPGDWAP